MADGNDLIVSARYRNRLNWQAIEQDSIVNNLSTNRQSTYGVNWALNQYEDGDHNKTTRVMLSARASNHLAELDKIINETVTNKRVDSILSRHNHRRDGGAAPVMKPSDGIVSDLDHGWTEQWPDEWLQGQGQGPVPDAIRSLPDSIQLINEIERWLLQQDDGAAVTDIPAGSAVQTNTATTDLVTSDLQSKPAPTRTSSQNSAANENQSIQTQTDTDHHHHHHRRIHDLVPGYRHRLLMSPLLYTPAGFGSLAAHTITLPRPRPQQKLETNSNNNKSPPRPRSGPVFSDVVVVHNQDQRRRRRRTGRKKKRRVTDDDVVTELNLSLHDQWMTPPLMSRASSSRKSSISMRKSSVAILGESQRGLGGPRARIQHGRLEFVIPESIEGSDHQQQSPETSSKLTALQRYRLRMQHRKKLREDSENFVDELEKQLDKSEIRARYLDPVHEPRFRQRFMQHSQSTIMKSLSGEAQRFLYSESKHKRRHLQIEQRQPRREMHQASQRLDQMRARQQHYEEVLQERYQLTLRQFHVEEAVAATRDRLKRYRQQTARLQHDMQTQQLQQQQEHQQQDRRNKPPELL